MNSKWALKIARIVSPHAKLWLDELENKIVKDEKIIKEQMQTIRTQDRIIECITDLGDGPVTRAELEEALKNAFFGIPATAKPYPCKRVCNRCQGERWKKIQAGYDPTPRLQCQICGKVVDEV